MPLYNFPNATEYDTILVQTAQEVPVLGPMLLVFIL